MNLEITHSSSYILGKIASYNYNVIFQKIPCNIYIIISYLTYCPLPISGLTLIRYEGVPQSLKNFLYMSMGKESVISNLFQITKVRSRKFFALFIVKANYRKVFNFHIKIYLILFYYQVQKEQFYWFANITSLLLSHK